MVIHVPPGRELISTLDEVIKGPPPRLMFSMVPFIGPPFVCKDHIGKVFFPSRVCA